MISLAHHWLITYRGGEKVLQEWRRLFPAAPISTLIHERGDIPEWIAGRHVITSPIQLLPRPVRRRYKSLLPLHPLAFRALGVPSGTRLVLSSDAAMVKALRVPKDAVHVCYCHSPPRYLWDMSEEYQRNLGAASRFVFRASIALGRRVDYAAAQRVTTFVANSHFVADRIKRFYGREASVIHPPVDVEAFECLAPRNDFYLIVSQLVPYKRVDLAIEAFNRLRLPLVVIGEGSEFDRLTKLAGPTIRLMGRQPFSAVKDHLQRCRAFIYPQIEDFGITAVEAQASGAPVIALRRGGALESVVEGVTGVFFDEQSSDSLARAVCAFELARNVFAAEAARKNAMKFSAERFRNEIKRFLVENFSSVVRGHDWNTDLQAAFA